MNAVNLVRAARTAESTGQFAQAIQLCNQALYLDPNCVDALLILGSFAARQGRVGEAETHLRKAVDADPASYDAARWLTTLLIGRRGGLEAVEFGRRAIQLKPHLAEAHAVLGLAAMGAGDSGLAISSFKQAIALSPKMAGAYHNLGIAYQREDSYDEAIAAFKQALELAPHVFETHVHLGRALLGVDRGDEAMAYARKALELNPNSVSARRLFADARFVAVHGDNGEALIRKAIEDEPNSGFPYALMGSRQQEQGDFTGAETSILRSIELQPKQGFAYYLLAHNRKMRTEDWPIFQELEAYGNDESLISVDRQYLHFALGKVHDDLGEYEKAMRSFALANEEPDRAASDVDPMRASLYSKRVRGLNDLFSREFLDQFKGLGFESDEPIFVFGMPRSGTTLLEQIISRHSKVGAAGEQFFWRDNSRRIINIGRGSMNSDELRKAGQRYLELLRSLAPGKAHVTEKFPSNYVYLGMLQLILPNARFIHAHRNPIDTCLSIYMRPFSTNEGLGRTQRDIVEAYRLYQQSMRHWREVLEPGRFLDVEYESMVRDPETVTRKVIAYCGLEWEDACLRPQEGDRRVVTFSKWQVRQPVYTTSVERWRRYEPWLGLFKEFADDNAG